MTYKPDDYRRGYRQIEQDTTWTAKRAIPWLVGLFVIVAGISFVVRIASQPGAILEKSTDADHIISSYEEFQNIYNTCQKLDADLKTIRETPDADPMFAQFSKGAMVAAKRQQMTRWVNEYNAKSKMVNRNLWKSNALPYQLNEEDFPQYNGGAR